MDPDRLVLLLETLARWLAQPPAPERCLTCGEETGDTISLTRWPQQTHCPHCGADLVPF